MTKVVFRPHTGTLNSVKSVLKKAYDACNLLTKKSVKSTRFPVKETPLLPLSQNSIFQKNSQTQAGGEPMEVFVYLVQEVANLKVQYFPRKLSDMTESHSETSDSQKVKEIYQNSEV